ncbi:tRNA1(Val) (adenine(37)-N6)-methyltransferase [Salipaludibacillus sp. CUR1]|uniref:tRNA1(Val) (adenine(37)-N6)-methyltransferase n=1 Tax=Salipaludibacillus sp. CUR1 TaxID=2820003 RepID=UPI001E60DE9F|nr:tRNA1(Val) (adenine(37)-N6)-methyltransferase [Salipaludibacillus sp. CUR1]MCE7791823.1 tRNA1(Val) (adenine(37)-N6)-methyltransferase [Salipaludibacillus sp. CUR1]
MTKRERIERLDYLPGWERAIYQRPDIFSYSMDAVLLGKFAQLPKSGEGKIMDLCTGTGAVPLIMSQRTRTFIEAVEIQPVLASLAEKSVHENNLADQVRVMEADILELDGLVRWESYDTVTCNPPYFPVTAEKGKNVNNHLSLARHEIACTLDDVIRVSSRLVKQKGRVAIVHRPERLPDIFGTMVKYRLEPKRIQYVHPKSDREANIVLVEAVREGKPGIKTMPPWIVYGEDDTYTREFKEHYE